MTHTLYYIHDPMCSWCWAFRPTYDAIKNTLPENLKLVALLGGLAPDTNQPMPDDMRHYIQKHWQTIQKEVPGTLFNFEFWNSCKPRRSTYPACRAVIAARAQDSSFEDKMILAIQQAYYLNARNPSETDTLIEIASEIGLNRARFETDLKSKNTNDILTQEINYAHQLGINAFPSLLLATEKTKTRIPINYGNPDVIIQAILNVLVNQTI